MLKPSAPGPGTLDPSVLGPGELDPVVLGSGALGPDVLGPGVSESCEIGSGVGGRAWEAARQAITVRVGAGGWLDARLPPTILADRCLLRSATTLDLAAGARLMWSEVVTLGRYGEAGGGAVLDLTVRQDGRTLLRTTTDLTDPVLRHSPALLGPNRTLGHALLVGVPAPDTPVRIANGCSQYVHSLDGAALLSVVGSEARHVIDAVDNWLASALV